MKFKRKIAGLLAALMVLTLGSTMVFADSYSSPSANDYNSPSADDYNVIREEIASGIIYVATGTDCQEPSVIIDSNSVKNIDAAVKTALAYKSKLNKNAVTDIAIDSADSLSVKISKDNMSTLASRKGNLEVNTKAPKNWNSPYAGDYCSNFCIRGVKNGKALDFSVEVKNNSKVDAKIKKAGYTGNTVQFTIGGAGSLPGVASIEYYSDNYKGASLETGYVYYYNAANDAFELVGEADAADDGTGFYTYGAIIANSGSYVFTKDKLPESLSTGNVISSSVKDAITNIKTEAFTKKGDTLKITDASSDNKIEKSTFEAAKAKGVNLVVESPKNNATFKFSNFDKLSEMSGAFDPTVTIGKSVVKAIDSAMADSKVTYLTVSFAYDGKLPGKTDVTLDLSEGGFKDGATVYLYYFNEKTNAFELVDEAKYTEGFAKFEMEHCSDYIVTAEKLGSTVTTPKATPASKNNASNSTKSAKSVKTSDTTPIIPLVVVMFAGIAAVVVAFYRKKRA